MGESFLLLLTQEFYLKQMMEHMGQTLLGFSDE
jgi:hypothetical protein